MPFLQTELLLIWWPGSLPSELLRLVLLFEEQEAIIGHPINGCEELVDSAWYKQVHG